MVALQSEATITPQEALNFSSACHGTCLVESPREYVTPDTERPLGLLTPGPFKSSGSEAVHCNKKWR